ncbi:serine hydrolase domain-containing protein [Actinacidiphila rubida]|uniref:CubicO group peptidase, beta-lactamase class C family n=1 Tax=Actinacidiphila rubida TaxID=310780 RepID=A0A1H8KPA2_9ACTN|nr:serine hydrolase domain-containing protein [Actinacidiphila rubida]SEN94732.1 CubicO group peptidase, beta-lactamase class C family [Actinacidiphila rubida]
MTSLGDLVSAGRDRGVYSAAAWSVGDAHAALARGFTGTRSWGGETLDGSELWDLASVTKPVAGLAVMALVDEGALRLTDTVGDHLPEYRGGDKADLTVHQLLAHTSGIPGQVPLYREHPTRAALLEAIRLLPLTAAPGTRVQYSSQGFILLGLVAEAAAGETLDVLVRRLVCDPLGMTGTGFHPAPEARRRAVATEDCPWRGRIVTGQVHDENAVVLGAPAGHAGLFAPLADMERLGRSLAGGARELLRPATFARMTAVHTEGLNLRRALAWQGQDPAGSPVGPSFGPHSYGHTGFTGTSIWVDPATTRYAVLLTNRVHPTRTTTGITPLRHAFHAEAAGLV